MIFCDWLSISQKHRDVRPLAGLRTISFRDVGDIDREGSPVEREEVLGERAHWAWVQGSHDTRLRVVSHNGVVALSGNPGRFGRPDNLFNLDFFDTIHRATAIMDDQGLPGFDVGEPVGAAGLGAELQWSGARVWCVHLTRNYLTGSPENARHAINWLDGQTVARVKKSRLGASTVAWGSLKYAQTEVYVKADEMLAHCRSDDEREAMRASPVYNWARDNGVLRVEVKAGKDYLRYKGLTYLGNWTVGAIEKVFEDRTEVLRRCRVDVDEFDVSALPRRLRFVAAAWMKGEDVRALYADVSRYTLWRHAKALRDYGIDILEPRNLSTFPVRVRTVELRPASVPEWYTLRAA